MQQAPGRRKGSAATESEARQSEPRSSSRSKSATKRPPVDGAARSGSQPKQRGASTRSASTGKSSGDKTLMQTPFEAALARMRKTALGKTDEQLEMMLQQLLQQRQFEDAAYLIAASPALEAKYKTADVIRLLLDIKQFDKAAQLIRDMKLQSNQLLVTLFIKELVRASLFQAAVRYAQEMVQNFGKKDLPRDEARPSWTPQALIQAMIRAQQFRSALKYAKQFELLDVFPPAQLIARMFEVRAWDEAVSSVLEFRLFQDFPLELLVQKLLEHRQWSNAAKCINKLPTQDAIEKVYEVLVRESARVGDFVTSLRYLREFKLDQPETHGLLLKYYVDCTIAHGELYKAIKYSIKFGLNLPPPDAEETGEKSVYDTELLIRKAIACGQYHVAETYIKKLKLRDQFANELELIKKQQERMLNEFHQFMEARSMQYSHPHVQSELATILGDYATEEKVDQVVEAEVVLSLEEEIIPRKPRKAPEDPSGEVQDLMSRLAPPSQPAPVEEAPRRSSRFSFARADSEIAAPASAQAQTIGSRPLPPPGLAPELATPSPVPSDSTSAPTFNFAQFAATLQPGSMDLAGQRGPAPPSQQLPQPPQGLSHLFPHQAPPQANGSRPAGFFPPPPPPPQQQQFGGLQNQHGFPGPPPPPPPQQSMPMYYQSPQQGFQHSAPPPNGSMQPPPPPPNGSIPPPPMPQFHGSNGGNPGGTFDVSSLAMQFHARPQAPSFGNSYRPPPPGQFGQGAPPPPPMPSGIPGGLFPTMGPPMQNYPPPPQPQFSFKPSVSYTSVTTTRQKKA